MIYGSVCSGIEAASVAWEPLGWRPAFFSEIDPFPRAVLAHHHPEVPLHGDFTTIEKDQYAAIDLLVGGTPCQSFSVAGLRAGLDDDRGNLALEFCRLARRLGPRWVVWENVPGVLSIDGGRAFGSILGGLAECGYGLAYRVLDAQYVRVDGYARAVPQRRNRVFVVGHLGSWQRAAAVLFEPESLRGDTAPRREAGASVAALTANGVGTCGADDNQAQAGHLIHDAQQKWPVDVAPTLNAHFGDKLGLEDQHALNGAGLFVPHAFDAWQSNVSQYGDITGPLDTDGTSIGVMIARSVAIRGRDGGGTIELGDDVAGTVRASQGGGDKPHVLAPIPFDTTQITSPTNRSVPEPGAPCHTLARGAHAPAIATRAAVRRLTPRECERLRGFPDDYTLISYRGKPAADGPRYKALGNSMACNVMRWIGRRIEMVERIQDHIAEAAQ